MTEEKIQWITLEKRKQVAFVTLLCLSSALIAFAPRNERRLFTVPGLPVGYMSIATPEETQARSDIFGPIDGGSRRFGEPTMQGFFARTPGGSATPLNQPGAIQRLASAATPSSVAGLAGLPADEPTPSALFAQPVIDNPAAVANGPAAEGAPSSSGGNGVGGGAPNAQPLPIVPPSAVNPNNQQPVPGAIPEPSTWLLMLGGFGIAGSMMRRRSAAIGRAALR